MPQGNPWEQYQEPEETGPWSNYQSDKKGPAYGESIEDEIYARSALPTGVPELDRAGMDEPAEQKTFYGGPVPVNYEIPAYTRPALVPESDEGRKASAAQRGVEVRVGAPIFARAAQAATINAPSAKAEALEKALDEVAQGLPEGVPLLEWDQDLGMMTYNRVINEQDVAKGLEPQENIGKVRATIIDEEGFAIADFADALNLAEIGSVLGSIIATVTGPGKIGFWRAGAREGAGGVIGREAGNMLGLGLHMWNGGEAPPAWELGKMFVTDVGMEMAASYLGEGVARGVISPTVSAVRRGYARSVGREGVEGMSEEAIRAENAYRRDSRAAIKSVQRTVDGDLLHTKGEVTGNSTTLQREADRAADATSKAKRQQNRQHVNNREVREQYIKNNLEGGNMPPELQGTVLREARDAVYEGSRIAIVSGEGGWVHVFPVASKEGQRITSTFVEETGIKMVDDGVNWNIRMVDDFGPLKGIGLGQETYEATALEARRHGRGLKSDRVMTDEAYQQWRLLDGKEGVGKVKWSEGLHSFEEGGRKFWRADTDTIAWLEPVPEGLTRNILDDVGPTIKGIRDAEGKFVKPTSQLDRVRVMSGGAELGAIKAEVEGNTFLKSELMTRMYKNYQDHVTPLNKQGRPSFNNDAHNQWLKESKKTMEQLLSPEEFQQVYGPPGGFRAMMEGLDNRAKQASRVLSTILGETGEDTFKMLKNSQDLSPQLRKLYADSPKSFQRGMSVLRSMAPETFSQMQRIVKNEVADVLKKANAGQISKKSMKNLENLFSKADRGYLKEFMGPRYFNDLNNFLQLARMSSARSGYKGQAAEAHPSGVMLARAIVFKNVFGRRQRIASAAQKFARQSNHDTIADIVADPTKLRLLMNAGHNRLATREGMQLISRLGLAEMAGINNIEDPNEAAKTLDLWARGQIAEYLEMLDQ